ncbi:hypothetical protein NECAME_14329 [Necator americanus]|uniref:Uncharacterized protein n=1 Tax=Necator americanus TaxID=51031 RepID=W2SQF7_NECAM|nr:hypothetical protein NECAME_14329 [Necator americanus]ETN71111.1 hypothetical protein NECAME_14329 [Necator americanus]
MRLDGWSRTVQEMNNDEDTLLMQVDELHTYLVNELDKAKDKKPEEVSFLSLTEAEVHLTSMLMVSDRQHPAIPTRRS